MKLSTYENIGSGPIHLPQEELHTAGMWLDFEEEDLLVYGRNRFEKMLVSLSHLMHHIGAVMTMSDRNDLHTAVQIKADHSEKSAIFLYDHYPGGIGLAEKLYGRKVELLERSRQMMAQCPCEDGCPSCIGEGSEEGLKQDVMRWVQSLLGR